MNTDRRLVLSLFLGIGLVAGPQIADGGDGPEDVQGLALWIRADQGVTKDDKNRVSAWANQSKAGIVFAQENPEAQPLFIDAALNGQPAIRFDGKDDFLAVPEPLDVSGGTTFLVMRCDPSGFGADPMILADDHLYFGILRLDKGELSYGHVLLTHAHTLAQNQVDTPKTGYRGDTRPQYHVVPIGLARYSLYTIGEMTEDRIGRLTYIAKSSRGHYKPWAGDMVEMLVYRPALSLADRRHVEHYLGAKYFNWPPDATVPVAANPVASKALLEEAAAADRVLADNVALQDRGTLLTGLTPTAPPPGRYRLHAPMAFTSSDAVNPADVQITLRVGSKEISRSAADLGEAGEYKEITMDFVLPIEKGVGGPLPIFIRWQHVGELIEDGARLARSEDGTVSTADLANVRPYLAARGVHIEALFTVSTEAAAKIRSYLEARTQPIVPPPVTVASVKTGKVLYEPGETAIVRVEVVNAGEAAATVTLAAFETTELADQREISRLEVEVPAQESLSIDIPFTPLPLEYGHEVRVELVQGGETIHMMTEPFSVADNLWKVCLGGMDAVSHSALADVSHMAGDMQRLRDSYTNWFEKFFWAPDDWGDLTPGPDETWISSQGGRLENTKKLQFAIQEAHKHGIRAITYGKAMAYGHVAWEIVRRHPDWFVLDQTGRPIGMPADTWVDLLDHWRNFDAVAGAKTGKLDQEYWVPRCYPDHRRLDAVDYAIDEIIGSTKIFGWDGVRFDSSGFRSYYIDGTKDGRDGVNIRNMKRLKERLWKTDPNYLIGHNTRIPPYISKDGRAYPLSPDDMTGHEFRETLAGGCLWMGEGLRSNPMRNGRVTYDSWSEYARNEVRCIRTIKHFGGHFCYSYGVHSARKAEDLYRFIIGTMMGAHQYGNDHMRAGGSESWGRFLTRWSGLVWDHRLKPLPEADAVSVRSDWPLWWEGFANQRVIGPTRRQVIVHLLNPPVNDKLEKTSDELPILVGDCDVTYQVPRGQTLVRAYFVSPGSPNRAEVLPVAQTGATAKVSLPVFDIWAMVVWELEGDFAVPKSPPRFTAPMSENAIAELEEWEGKRVKINVADDLLDPTPQHDSTQVKPRQWDAPTIEKPEGLVFGGDPGLDILVFKGLHNYAYRIPEAVQELVPAARLTQITGRPKEMPKGSCRLLQI